MNEIHIPVIALEEAGCTYFLSKGEWYGKSEDFIRRLAKAHEVIYDIHGVETLDLSKEEWELLRVEKPLDLDIVDWNKRDTLFDRVWRYGDEVNFYVK